MNRNNEVALVCADAFVMYYDNKIEKWIASGASKSVTIAKVQILQNITTNQFRIFAWNPINKEILVNTVLYHNLRFQKAHATFHEWRDADTQLVYGLHFADQNDALLFGGVITRVFKSLELIYQECRLLQSQLRATSSRDQYNASLIDRDQRRPANLNPFIAEQFNVSPCIDNGTKVDKFGQYAPTSNSIEIRHASIFCEPNMDIVNRDADVDSPHNYENIDNILANHNSAVLSSLDRENVDLTANKFQSSSDDSVRGLVKQSSSNSSGYATVASFLDPFSTIPKVQSSMVLDADNGLANKSSSNNSDNTPQLMGLQTEIVQAQSSQFASELQNMVQLRKSNQFTRQISSSENLGLSLNNSKCGIGVPASDRSVDSVSKEPQLPLPDDIMSEMKLILQRRKRLIDGHTDLDYSSSTDKSDTCSDSTSDEDSLAGKFDQRNHYKSTPPKFSQNEGRSRQMSVDLIDISRSRKISDIDSIYLSSPDILFASKCDLERIKRDLTENFRKDFSEIKKEVLDVIRMVKTVLQ